MVLSCSDPSVDLAAHCCHHHAVAHPCCSALLSPSCCRRHGFNLQRSIFGRSCSALLSPPRCRHHGQCCPPQKRSIAVAAMVLSCSDPCSVDLAAHCCHHHAVAHSRCPAVTTTLWPILVAAHCCRHHAVAATVLICSDPSSAGLAARCCRHHGQRCPPQKRSIAVAAMVLSHSDPSSVDLSTHCCHHAVAHPCCCAAVAIMLFCPASPKSVEH